MDVYYREKLRRHRPFIVENILDIDEIIDILISDGALSFSLKEDLDSCSLDSFKIRKLLDYLNKKTIAEFQMFCSALKSTGNGHIALKLTGREATEGNDDDNLALIPNLSDIRKIVMEASKDNNSLALIPNLSDNRKIVMEASKDNNRKTVTNDHRKTVTNDKDKQILKELRVYLVKNMIDVEGVIDILYSKNILHESHKNLILSHQERTKQVRTLLDILPKRLNNTMFIFIEALEETDNMVLVKKIKECYHS